MLTIPVNIAVFAAFHFVFRRGLLSDVEFKPIWPIWQLDMWRYGWQKWQEVAWGMAKTARNGKVSGKNGKDVGRCEGIQVCGASGARG